MVSVTSALCDKSYRHRSSLSKHKLKHMMGNEDIYARFECRICNLRFTQVAA